MKKAMRFKGGKSTTTSKKLIAFLFINCTVIELFTMYVTLKSFYLAYAIGMMVDFTPLVTLIGAVVGEVIGFAIYSLKAAKENTKGGIIYEASMREQYYKEQEQEQEEDTVG